MNRARLHSESFIAKCERMAFLETKQYWLFYHLMGAMF
jgi:hypothetical protein